MATILRSLIIADEVTVVVNAKDPRRRRDIRNHNINGGAGAIDENEAIRGVVGANVVTDDVAGMVGKSRSHVANTLRLLKLSEPIQMLVRSGQLSAGHARQLVGQPNALELANDIIKRGLNVRQIELEMRKDGARKSRKGAGTARAKDADTKALEKRLSDALGLHVAVDHRGQGGTLHIKYRNLDQLDAVLRKLDR